MIYEFEDKRGNKVELYYPISEAPMPSLRPDEKPVISHASPRWHGMKEKKGGFYRHYTRDGKPIIDSRAAREAAQRDAAVTGETILNARDVD